MNIQDPVSFFADVGELHDSQVLTVLLDLDRRRLRLGIRQVSLDYDDTKAPPTREIALQVTDLEGFAGDVAALAEVGTRIVSIESRMVGQQRYECTIKMAGRVMQQNSEFPYFMFSFGTLEAEGEPILARR